MSTEREKFLKALVEQNMRALDAAQKPVQRSRIWQALLSNAVLLNRVN